MKKIRKPSVFMNWMCIYVTVFVLLVIVYAILDHCGLVEEYVTRVTNRKQPESAINIIAIFIAVIIYGVCSLYNLLSHRAVQDSRMHCLSIVLSAFFLIIENALLHANQTPNNSYYDVTMLVFTTIALFVTTFASLKFSFEISNKQRRYSETSAVKPDIKLIKRTSGYFVTVFGHDCYFCGVYIGEINKVKYIDNKRTGTQFKMEELFYSNLKHFINKEERYKIKLVDLGFDENDSNNIDVKINKGNAFFIFKDLRNYFYFVKVPNEPSSKINIINSGSIRCDVFGANEYMVSRLMHKRDLRIQRSQNAFLKRFFKSESAVFYEAMDWFVIPYNFYP